VNVKIIFGKQTEESKELAYQIIREFLLEEVKKEQTKRR
jgi:hypothetical protein